MSNAIDKFKARLAKAQAKKDKEAVIEAQEAVIVTEEKAEITPDAVQEITQIGSKKTDAILIEEKTIKEAFEKWLIENGHAKKYAPEQTISSIEKASAYAVSKKMIAYIKAETSLFEIIDVKKFNAIRSKLQQDRIFRFSEKGNAKAFEAAGIIFSQFLKAFDFSNYTSEPVVIQAEKTDEVSRQVETVIRDASKSELTSNAEVDSIEIDENAELKEITSSIQVSLKSVRGKRFIAEMTPRKNDGFIFDIISNMVSIGKESSECPEFIRSSENALYEVHPHSLADFGLNEMTSVRRAYLTSDLSLLGSTVDRTLAGIERGATKPYYYLPDNTDLFSNNIKQGFSGYTFVWRSVAAAYRYFSTSKASDIKVVDLFEHEPVQISIKAEISPKYGNVTVFTRYKKNMLGKVCPLCYPKVAEAFWREFVAKSNVVGLDIKSLRDSNLTYKLLNYGEPFDLVCNDKRFIVNDSMAKAFLKAYLQQYNDALSQLTGCVVYGEYLSLAGVADSFAVLKDSTMGEPLNEFKSRAKKGVPLWVETLPKLALGRVANKGRLGEYILVDEGKEVENLFSIIRIPCKEQLTLPAGHKEIRFPLTIGGSITDKSFIAKVTLEEELNLSTKFNVELRYEFDNEKSYDFVLSNQQFDNLRLTIEEGVPERRNYRFELNIDDSATKPALLKIKVLLKELLETLRERQLQARPRRKDINNGVISLREKQWELKSRKLSRQIFMEWQKLPSQRKQEKIALEKALSIIKVDAGENLIPQILIELKCNYAYKDDIDEYYAMNVLATLSLLSNKAPHISLSAYKKILHIRMNSNYFPKGTRPFLRYDFEPKIFCNSDFDAELIGQIIDDAERPIRVLSLPLLVNDALLNSLVVDNAVLKKMIGHLEAYFNERIIEVKKTVPSKLDDVLKWIRDGYEFALALLRVRDESNEHMFTPLLQKAETLEARLNDKILNRTSTGDYISLLEHQDLIDEFGNSVDCNLSVSRIELKDVPENLSQMHPLALAAITYLEGNPDIHIIGCGLKDETD